ncbi:hypothetical protein JL720_5039 [Aureococcus anophagefferens]|nr:hypothetical protein JL720_5039 [Aureococcus anophagefferens]
MSLSDSDSVGAESPLSRNAQQMYDLVETRKRAMLQSKSEPTLPSQRRRHAGRGDQCATLQLPKLANADEKNKELRHKRRRETQIKQRRTVGKHVQQASARMSIAEQANVQRMRGLTVVGAKGKALAARRATGRAGDKFGFALPLPLGKRATDRIAAFLKKPSFLEARMVDRFLDVMRKIKNCQRRIKGMWDVTEARCLLLRKVWFAVEKANTDALSKFIVRVKKRRAGNREAREKAAALKLRLETGDKEPETWVGEVTRQCVKRHAKLTKITEKVQHLSHAIRELRDAEAEEREKRRAEAAGAKRVEEEKSLASKFITPVHRDRLLRRYLADKRAAHILECEEDAIRRRAGGYDQGRFGVDDARRLMELSSAHVGEVTEMQGIMLKEDSIFASYRWPPLVLLDEATGDDVLRLIKRAVLEHFILRKFGKKFWRLRCKAALVHLRAQAARTVPRGKPRTRAGKRRRSYHDPLERWGDGGAVYKLETKKSAIKAIARRNRALKEAVKRAVGREDEPETNLVAAVARLEAKKAHGAAEVPEDLDGGGDAEAPAAEASRRRRSSRGEREGFAGKAHDKMRRQDRAKAHFKVALDTLATADQLTHHKSGDASLSALSNAKMHQQDRAKQHFHAALDTLATADELTKHKAGDESLSALSHARMAKQAGIRQHFHAALDAVGFRDRALDIHAPIPKTPATASKASSKANSRAPSRAGP